ncbi:MAG TPA: cytochrome P450 [Novosphingobium sp.]
MSTASLGVIPAHVPPSLVLDMDPWQGGAAQPHDWLMQVAGGSGFAYSPYNPLPQDRGEGCWVARGAREIRAILIDNRNFVNRDSTGVGKLLGQDLVLAPLESDAPDHQRLRAILQPLFVPSAVQSRRAQIRSLALELIGGFAGKGRCEFIEDFAVKLPTQIFLEIMGLPVSDLPRFLEWEEIAMGRGAPEKMVETWLAIRAYLSDAIAARRTAPRDDLLTRVVAETARHGVNPAGEALGMALILFVAGLDTVVTALGWHFKHLAEHPDQQQRLRDNPALIPAAVEEMLRTYAFTSLTRTAVRDIEVCGVLIKAGDKVVCPSVLGSRDPVDFADAQVVDFDRGALRHLAFGFGQHICVGMHLARLELITAIECWLERIPPFRLPPGYQPPWHGGISLGLDALELEW